MTRHSSQHAQTTHCSEKDARTSERRHPSISSDDTRGGGSRKSRGVGSSRWGSQLRCQETLEKNLLQETKEAIKEARNLTRSSLVTMPAHKKRRRKRRVTKGKRRQTGGGFPYFKEIATQLYKDRKQHKAFWRKHGKLLQSGLGVGMI